MPRRILIVDDHPVVRQALRSIIEGFSGMEVCGEAATDVEAIRYVPELRPDLVIVDLALQEGGSGIELTKRLLSMHPALRVLIFTARDEEVFADRALKAGALGFVMKTAPADEIVKAICTVADGQLYVSAHLQSRILRQYLQPAKQGEHAVASLTDREFEVLELIGRGWSARRMAEALGIGTKTAEAHRANIRAKLGLESSEELVRYAVGWFEN